MKRIRIAGRPVGEGEKCFIIADAGSNHNRDLRTAKRLVDVAADAGVDAVKFQTYSADKLYSESTPVFPGEKERPYKIIKCIELPREWHVKLQEHARKRGLIFLSTPFDFEAIDELEELDIPAYKWASSEITDLPMLKYAASLMKPMIVSTGMCNVKDVRKAVDAIHSTGNKSIALLHCTSVYPTKPNQANLRMMDTLKKEFGLPVGLSDHSLGIYVSVAAAARGACIIEKHITLSRKNKGPDHPFAMEPEEMKALVSAIRTVEESIGSDVKSPINEEKCKIRLSRRSVIAAQDIPRGEKISRDMLIVKRPGLGIEPEFIDKIVGKIAKRNIKRDTWITWRMI